MSQRSAILAALMKGARLTPVDALQRFGCLRLAARAADLRRAGHDVRCTIVERGGKRVGLYSMAKVDRA